MEGRFAAAARTALEGRSDAPVYRRLADALAAELAAGGAAGLPSARALAPELGLNRATVTAAYRELARRGLIALRPGRPRTAWPPAPPPRPFVGEPPPAALDLARWAPDPSLLPPTRLLRWLGLGQGEGEAVAQYGDVRGYAPLRGWIAERLAALGVAAEPARVVLTAGAQHALDLLLRALVRPGDCVLVEDPTYPGLPPLLALHGARALGARVEADGLDLDRLASALRAQAPRLAILTPTLHNPSGAVLDGEARRRVLALLPAETVVVEELFEPGLVCEGEVPPPLAALDARVVAVGSFSKALFPGLRVGYLTGPAAVLERVTALKAATDLSGSPFLEATAWALCRKGLLDDQLVRLRDAARERRAAVLAALAGAPAGVRWSVPRGGFSLLVATPGASAVAARAAERGVWVLPGPAMSVTGRDDVIRLAYAAAGGGRLREGLERFVAALSGERRPAAVMV